MQYHAYAATKAKSQLEPFEYSPGELGPDEVEIAVSHCGVCHTDAAMLDNDWGVTRYPFVPGHAGGGNAGGVKREALVEWGARVARRGRPGRPGGGRCDGGCCWQRRGGRRHRRWGCDEQRGLGWGSVDLLHRSAPEQRRLRIRIRSLGLVHHRTRCADLRLLGGDLRRRPGPWRSALGWLGGVPNETNRLSQTVTLPANALRLTFAGALRVQLFEEHSIVDFSRISLAVSGQRLSLFEFDNGDATDDWVDIGVPVDVTAYAGQALTLEIESQIGAGPGTNFYVDDLALASRCSP